MEGIQNSVDFKNTWGESQYVLGMAAGNTMGHIIWSGFQVCHARVCRTNKKTEGLIMLK